MKRVILSAVCLMISLVMFAACGGSTGSQNSQSSAARESESAAQSQESEALSTDGVQSFTVGLIQLVEHPSLDEIRTAFVDQLTQEGEKQGYTIQVDYKNAQNDNSMINSICRQFVDDQVDAIVAIATPAAQGAATSTSDIPIIFSAVTDPVAAGLMEDIEKPGANITGTSDAIAVDRIFDLADELTPGIEKFGFIYNKGETNSVSVIGQAMEYLDSKGIAYVEKTVTNAGEVQQTARVLLEECGAVFAPIDNTVASAMNVLTDEAIKVGKPVYVAADSMVADGGLATVGVNYTQLGKQTADMTLRVLSGTPITEVPAEVLTDLSVVVNQETADALNVDVSKYAQ